MAGGGLLIPSWGASRKVLVVRDRSRVDGLMKPVSLFHGGGAPDNYCVVIPTRYATASIGSRYFEASMSLDASSIFARDTTGRRAP